MVKRKNTNGHESRLDYDQAGAEEERGGGMNFALGSGSADGGGTFSKADSATLASRRRVYATVTHSGGQGSRAYRKYNYLKELTKLNEKFKTFAEAKLAEIKAEIDSGKIPEGEPRFFMDAAAQYAAAVKEIRERYMPPIGDVLTVGTGEMGQLGFEEDDLNALMTFYRPMLIRNLRGEGIVQVSALDWIENLTVRFRFYDIFAICSSVAVDLCTHTTQLAAGAQFNIALNEEGKVYTWGCNDEGALGQLDYTAAGTPGKIDTAWVPNVVKGFLPTPVPDGMSFIDRPDAQIVAVASGDCHGAALSTDGDVYMWGCCRDREGKKWRGIFNSQDPRRSWEADLRSSDEKEEGIPPEQPPRGIQWFPVKVDGLPKKAMKIECSASAIFAILEDGSLWGWGLGETGEMGRPTPKIRDDHTGKYDVKTIQDILLVPTQVHFGEPGDGVYERWVVNVGCGLYHTLVVVREHCAKYPRGRHVVYSMGACNYGQLGQGFHDTKDDSEKMTDSEDKTDGAGGGGEVGAHPVPIRIKELDNCDIRLVAGGEHHSLVADFCGTNLYAFGRGDSGQLGHEDHPDEHTQEDSPVPIYLDWENKTNPVIKSLSCGSFSSFAVCEDGTAYSWGFGENGSLCHGRTKKKVINEDDDFTNVPKDQPRPKKITLKKSKQDEGQETGTKIQMIACGAQHAVLLVAHSQEL
jgi:regulator of chromosome condensation